MNSINTTTAYLGSGHQQCHTLQADLFIVTDGVDYVSLSNSVNPSGHEVPQQRPSLPPAITPTPSTNGKEVMPPYCCDMYSPRLISLPISPSSII